MKKLFLLLIRRIYKFAVTLCCRRKCCPKKVKLKPILGKICFESSLWKCWLIVCIVIQHVSIASSDLGAQNMDHNVSIIMLMRTRENDFPQHEKYMTHHTNLEVSLGAQIGLNYCSSLRNSVLFQIANLIHLIKTISILYQVYFFRVLWLKISPMFPLVTPTWCLMMHKLSVNISTAMCTVINVDALVNWFQLNQGAHKVNNIIK